MRLFLTDFLLTRFRLVGSPKSEVPWESPAAGLAAVEKLIHACGYHRRDDELDDAKHWLPPRTRPGAPASAAAFAEMRLPAGARQS